MTRKEQIHEMLESGDLKAQVSFYSMDGDHWGGPYGQDNTRRWSNWNIDLAYKGSDTEEFISCWQRDEYTGKTSECTVSVDSITEDQTPDPVQVIADLLSECTLYEYDSSGEDWCLWAIDNNIGVIGETSKFREGKKQSIPLVDVERLYNTIKEQQDLLFRLKRLFGYDKLAELMTADREDDE